MKAPEVTRWMALPLGENDQAEVRALFERVFGTPMSEALWRWKYGQGRGCAWGVRQASRGAGVAGHAEGGADAALALPVAAPQAAPLAAPLAAHYGGMRRALCLCGRTIDAVQMGDVMVRPDARGVLSRRGPFARVTRGFIETHVGPAPRHAIGFGFPNARHARLGELLGLYRALGEVRELRWRTEAVAARVGWRWALTPAAWESAEDARRTGILLDALWGRMRAALGEWVLPRRDAAWCMHRYLAHPHHRYQIRWLRCRFTRHVRGAVVLRPHADTAGGTAGALPRSWEWVDWIGDPRHLRQALRVTLATAAGDGVRELHGWFSAPLIHAHLTDDREPDGAGRAWGAAPVYGAANAVVCTWCVTAARAPGLPEGVDEMPWWLTSGDTDFR